MGDMADYYREHDFQDYLAGLRPCPYTGEQPRRRTTMDNARNGFDGQPEDRSSPWDHDTYRRDANVSHDPITNLWVHASTMLMDGQVLKLIREPDNKFDANAVAVYEALWTTFPACEVRPSGQVGYIPKGIAELYAPLMDSGAQVFATMIEKVRKGDRITHLKVRIGLLAASACPLSGDSPDLGGMAKANRDAHG